MKRIYETLLSHTHCLLPPPSRNRKERKQTMTNINWRAEALEFAKAHNTSREMVIQLVEKAMQHGATLMVIKVTNKLKVVGSDLERRHKESAPHKHQSKLIDVDLK